MNLVVLDTDVASTILRGRQTERLQAKLAGKNWLISFVTLGELTQWTIARSWGPRKLAHVAEWRRDVTVATRGSHRQYKHSTKPGSTAAISWLCDAGAGYWRHGVHRPRGRP